MIIDRLVLKNFKRFRNEEIHFRDGITGILGNNGTGKSSIVEAIFFALYGVEKTGSLQSDYIISSFASPKEQCEVRLDFRIGGDNYSVTRTLKNGKTIPNKTTFHKNGKLFATGVREVETEVRRTIGMGRVDFRNTIYAAQKDLLTLLESDPSKRKEWFLRALGIAYLNTESQKILKERADAKTGELQSLEGELKAITGRQSEVDLAALHASVNEFNQTITSLNKQHRDLDEKKKAVNEEFRLFQDQRTEYTRLVQRQSSLTKEKDGLLEQRDLTRSKLIDPARLEQEYRVLEQRLSPFQERKRALDILRELKSEFNHIQDEVRFAERDCADLRRRVEKSQTKITALNEDAVHRATLINGVRKTLHIKPEIPDTDLEQTITSFGERVSHAISTLSARKKRLTTEERKLLLDWETIKNAGADGICPLCRQTLGTHYASIKQEFESQLQSIKDEMIEVQGKEEKVNKIKGYVNSQKPILSEIRSLSEKLKMWDSVEAEHKDLVAQLQTKELAHQSLMQKFTGLKFDERVFKQTEKEIKELEQIQARFNNLREKLAQVSVFKKQVAGLEEQITRKQAEIKDLTSEIAQSSFDPKKGETLEQARAEIDAALRTIEEETTRTKERLRQVKEKIAEYKETEKQIAGLHRNADALREEIELVKLTRSIIANYVIYLMQVVRSRIEGEVSRIISEITSGRYEQVLLDEDFNLLVRDIDNDYSIDRFSGGEQDDIAVALRIALSRYLAELHQVHESTILIFDEIFGSQDEERRNNLLTTLRTQESRFPQIILISHLPEMQGEFTNTLVVEMGSDQVSRVKEVE
jgi:exonuclease SbcC